MPSYSNEKEKCLVCERIITTSTFGVVFRHKRPNGEACPASSKYYGAVKEDNETSRKWLGK